MKALLLVSTSLVLPATMAFAQSGSISGVVTRWPTGEPAAGAAVKLTGEAPSIAPSGFQLQSTTTDASGSFRCDNVPAGAYYVAANLSGYLPGEYGRRRDADAVAERRADAVSPRGAGRLRA